MGQLIRQIKKKNGLIRRFAEEEDAVGVVEIILILVGILTPYYGGEYKVYNVRICV